MTLNVKVSIPIEVSGYTGQYDAWESFTRDYMVTVEDDGRVFLESMQSTRDRIAFDFDDLKKALDFLKPPGPAIRSTDPLR